MGWFGEQRIGFGDRCGGAGKSPSSAPKFGSRDKCRCTLILRPSDRQSP
jgi:hypothetical protein